MKIALLSLALLAGIPGSAALAAEPDNQPMTVEGQPVTEDMYVLRIAYGDLNLTQPDQARELKSRVKVAIRGNCNELFPILPHSDSWTCQAKAQRVADPQVVAAIQQAGTLASGTGAPIILRFARR
ncbi:UrcA family protein [Novosphingobium flavum]|uniref:UrcA family protein n=1 Tax=Novosphingobium flavum TaxID=1778672 RepID=A0A7X1FTP0_9SPHN|nr:UrcA family protein [Novosphingobium flavum]MBC2666768.1 UrcA family protein [Novosphingobium flavum]